MATLSEQKQFPDTLSPYQSYKSIQQRFNESYGFSPDEVPVPDNVLTYEDCDEFPRGRYSDVKIFPLLASSTESTTTMTSIERLPTQILHLILSDLDILSLCQLSRINHTFRAVVSNLPTLADLRQASRIVTPLRQFGLLGYYSIKDLVNALRKSNCACCRSRLGAFVFLPTLDRACYSCLLRCSRFRIMQPEIADLAFGLRLSAHHQLEHHSTFDLKCNNQTSCPYTPFRDIEGARYKALGHDPVKCADWCSRPRYEGVLISLSDALRLGIAQHGSFRSMRSMLKHLSKKISRSPPTAEAIVRQMWKRGWHNEASSKHRGSSKRNLMVAAEIASFLLQNKGKLPCEAEQPLDESITEFGELFECGPLTGSPRMPIYLPWEHSFEEPVWCWPCHVVGTGPFANYSAYSDHCQRLRDELAQKGLTLHSRASETGFTLSGFKRHAKSCPVIQGFKGRSAYLEEAYRLLREEIIEEYEDDAEW